MKKTTFSILLIVGAVGITYALVEKPHTKASAPDPFTQFITENPNDDATQKVKDSVLKIQQQFAALEKQNLQQMLEISALKETQDNLLAEKNNEPRNNYQEDYSETDSYDQEQQDLALVEAEQFEYINSVENYFSSQSKDNTWSTQVEADFSSAINNYSEHYTLNDVSCGDTMCKVNAAMLENTLSEESPPLDHLIHGDVAWAGQSLYEMNTDTGEITMYLMRDGEELPEAIN